MFPSRSPPIPDPLIESVTVCPDVKNGIWVGTLQGRIFQVVDNEVRSVNNNVTASFPLERLRDPRSQRDDARQQGARLVL
ncbi:MAG: hypothetical protein WDM76_06635 [Limisphaerales bacterium]